VDHSPKARHASNRFAENETSEKEKTLIKETIFLPLLFLPDSSPNLMALDFNAAKMLLWARNLEVSFERTLTLGRQGLSCSPGELRKGLRDFGFEATAEQIRRIFEHPPMTSLFAEEFLRFLGAAHIVSVDRSDYEGASMLHDLNERFPSSHQASFSVVLDAGTLEHVFNYPAALRHCLELVRPGGHFISTTPANNLIGHGFYQISPELFFRVLSPENGFALRKIILYDCLTADAPFYLVHDPSTTQGRTNLRSSRPLYLGILAERTAVKPILSSPPQQSDYVQIWDRARAQAADTNVPRGVLGRLRVKLNPYWPYWLRRLKMALVYARLYGPPTLRNRRHFRRLSRAEMCEERSGPLPKK
jgi:SAM-dependent methyltransferase